MSAPPSLLFEFFEELAASVDADALLDYLSDCAYAMQEDESYVAEQLEAVACCAR